MSYYIPAIIRETSEGTARIPIADTMFQRREIWLTGEITSEVADAVIAQILHLDAEDPDAEITLYIDSPGGSVTAGWPSMMSCRRSLPTSVPCASARRPAWRRSCLPPETGGKFYDMGK